MGIGLGGVQQLGGGTVIADLIGQDIVAKSISLSQASGSNAVLLQTAGARLKFSSGGTTDYFSGDGSTIITAAGGLGAGVGFQFGGAYVLNGGNGSTGSTDIRGNATNAANSVAFTVGNTTALATAGGQIQAWYRDLFITKVAFLDRDGSITQGIGTAATAAQPGGALNVQSTPASNVSTGETDLFTYSLPASTMTTTNRGITVTCYGSNLGSATTKTLKFYFGTAIQTVTLPITNAGDWELQATIIRTSLSNQRFAVRLAVENDAAATVASWTVTQGTAAQTETGAITVKVTGQDSVGSGAITANLWNVSAL